MAKSTYLSAQLRESAPYLREAGWRQTADLVAAAAEEIEALRLQVEKLTHARESQVLHIDPAHLRRKA
jgi:hypothetical protein